MPYPNVALRGPCVLFRLCRGGQAGQQSDCSKEIHDLPLVNLMAARCGRPILRIWPEITCQFRCRVDFSPPRRTKVHPASCLFVTNSLSLAPGQRVQALRRASRLVRLDNSLAGVPAREKEDAAKSFLEIASQNGAIASHRAE